MKISQYTATYDTHFALSVFALGATLPWLGKLVFPQAYWGSQQASGGLVQGNLADKNPCGVTPNDARARGCHFESYTGTWQLPECYDKDLDEEFRALRPWKFFGEKNGTVDVSLSEVENESIQAWTTWEFHLWQCSFLWKKEVKIAHGLVSGAISPHQCLDHALMQDERYAKDHVGVPYWPRFTPCESPSDISIHQFELKPADFGGEDGHGTGHPHGGGSHSDDTQEVHHMDGGKV